MPASSPIVAMQEKALQNMIRVYFARSMPGPFPRRDGRGGREGSEGGKDVGTEVEYGSGLPF